MILIEGKQLVSRFCTLWNVKKIKHRRGRLYALFLDFLWLQKYGKMKSEECGLFFLFFHSERLCVCHYLWYVVVCVCVRESVSGNSSWRSLCCSCSSQVNSHFKFCSVLKVFTFVSSFFFPFFSSLDILTLCVVTVMDTVGTAYLYSYCMGLDLTVDLQLSQNNINEFLLLYFETLFIF